MYQKGDIVIIYNPDEKYERYKGLIGTVTDCTMGMVQVQFSHGDSMIAYNREVKIAKNYIVQTIIKDL